MTQEAEQGPVPELLPCPNEEVRGLVSVLQLIADEGMCSADDPVRRATSLLTRLSAENDKLHERNAEVQMLAFKWMDAHDKLKAGEPYQFPNPTDLPKALAENDRQAAQIAALEETIDAGHRAAGDLASQVMAKDSLLRKAREVISNEAIPTLLAIRASAAGNEWEESAEHFSALCKASIIQLNEWLKSTEAGQ